mgnify:FL=1
MKSNGKFAGLLKRVMQRRQLYLLLALPLVYLIIFSYIPMFGVQIAFKNYTPARGIWGSEWAGFKYFIRFFKSYQFTGIIRNTLVVSIYQIAVSTPSAIILALLINAAECKWFKKTIQTVTYIPHFISVVVLIGMINQIFNPIAGIYGSAYSMLFHKAAPNILGIPKAFYHTYVWSEIWQNTGWSSIIYVAALASSDQALHEAAQIDGASRFKRMIYIDLPVIVPTMVILLIMKCGQIMSVGYTKTLLMQNSFNISYSEVISTYVYKVGLGTNGNYSYGTAVDLFNSVINILLIYIMNFISKKVSEESLW